MKISALPSLLIPAISLFGISWSSAAPITWGAATNTGGKADLIEGTIVTALNGGLDDLAIGAGGSTGTSNYNFAASNYTTINFASTGDDAGDTVRARTNQNQYAPETVQTTGDAEFDKLISAATDPNGEPSGIVTGTMLLEGLEVGIAYQIQVFFNEQRTLGTTPTDTRIMTYGDGAGNTVALAGGDPALEVQIDHYGQFVVGTFTADATTQALTMDSSLTEGFGNVHYNAILVTGPEDLNVPPHLADAAFEVDDGAPADTLVATLVASDGNQDDTLTYTITAGDPNGVFSLDPSSGELKTAALIDVNDAALYNLTVQVSDGTATDSAAIDITVVARPVGGTITWGPAQNTSSVSDLLSGTVVYARNGGDPISVGGIDFETIDLGSGFLADSYGNVGGIFSTGDAEFDTLISGFTYGGGSGTADLPDNITGLTPGRRYSVQVFFNDQRNCCSDRVMAYSDGQGNTVDVGSGAILGTGEADDYGQFAIGEFVADGTSQVLQLTPGGFGNNHINAILVVAGGGSPEKVRISAFSFDSGTNEASLTWTSTPGTVYALRYSSDLSAFDSDIDDSIPASAGEETTANFTLPVDIVGLPRLFFRIEPSG